MLLVLASARSGTTLLGTLLDLHPGVTFVGELNRRRGWLEGQGICACGLTYGECPVWAPLAARPSFAPDSGRTTSDRRATAPEIRALQVAVRRPAAVIRLLLGLPTAGQLRYVGYMEQLYRDIAEQADAPVVVDTSKKNLVEILLFLTLGSLSFEVVHLYRDPRGVVASRLRGRVAVRSGPVGTIPCWPDWACRSSCGTRSRGTGSTGRRWWSSVDRREPSSACATRTSSPTRAARSARSSTTSPSMRPTCPTPGRPPTSSTFRSTTRWPATAPVKREGRPRWWPTTDGVTTSTRRSGSWSTS